ncbi:MAG TPA: FecR domain-containing protein [Polyangiaceae bacterium]|jgi:ferric-dicitrate binding protein FerR (iron transport regulator)|nr:FecR domain-containing protein [Polyangiaceae bacterium]
MTAPGSPRKGTETGTRDVRILVGALLAAALLVGYAATRWLVQRGDDTVAVLTSKSGQAERDSGGSVGVWHPAETSAKFFVGDGIRTGKDSGAKLELADHSALRLESSTLVRFLERPTGPAHQHVDVQMGEAVLETGGTEVSLDTDIGVAVLEPGTSLSMKKVDKTTRYEVEVGMARFESKSGEKTELAVGQAVFVDIGTAKLERVVPSATASVEPPTTAPAGSTETPEPVTLDADASDVTAHVSGGAVLRKPGEQAFTHLAAGDAHIPGGSTVRLAAGSSADVARGGQHVTLRGAGEFVVGASGKPFIVTQGGGVSLTGAPSELEVAVPGGSIVARLGAKGEVGVGRDSTKVSVTGGSAELRGESGNEELAAGEEGVLGKKGAEVLGRGPAVVDLVVAAGASFAVHDPHPPTAIGFGTGTQCPEGATIQLSGAPRVRSNGATTSVLVSGGAHKYAIRCVGAAEKDVVASGTIAVIADAGTARIPRTAPATAVDTDGRSYTVLYQNLLPKLTIRWPNAPSASGYTLHVVSPGGKQETLTTATPAYSFPSGALHEGEHHAFYEGGGARTKDTRIDIKFDNAAPTATLTSPANGGFAPGSTVTVAGAALEGWKISVGGKDLPLDDQLRFSGEATAPAGERALAIEFVHPKRGLHYYLRRASP